MNGGARATDDPARVLLAELLAALSMASDLAMGQPLEHALCACVLAMRLGESLGLDDDALRDVYYEALLRFIGCNADTHFLAALVGDEIALRTDFATVDAARQQEVVAMLVRSIRAANAGSNPLQLVRQLAHGLIDARRLYAEGTAGHCEVAQRLAERLGLGPGVILALGQLYERWDGRGLPRGLKGEAIALPVRLVTLAQDAVVFQRLGGLDAAVTVARERAGSVYEPRLVEQFCARAPTLFADLEGEPTWETVLALEPAPHAVLADAALDTACTVLADFTDIKSPYLLGHSSGVATLAAAAAERGGLPRADVATVRRAAWLHDLGRVGISAGVWGRAGPLTARDWERVRLHAYYTERVLARPAALAALGQLAALHHERLDGSGYHRNLPAALLPPAARVLAAADVYHALTEPRPHRPARAPAAAADELRREVRAGRLDGAAADSVLAAAGHGPPRRRAALPAGLSEREVEVLRLLARGQSIKQIAAELVIAPKTADNHIQHIYTKIGVNTRAGATLFAMEQQLLPTTSGD